MAGQGDERRTEGKVIKKAAVSKRLLFFFLFLFFFSNAQMPFWESGKAESVQQDYSQSLMSYLVLATLPREMVLLGVQYEQSYCTNTHVQYTNIAALIQSIKKIKSRT